MSVPAQTPPELVTETCTSAPSPLCLLFPSPLLSVVETQNPNKLLSSRHLTRFDSKVSGLQVPRIQETGAVYTMFALLDTRFRADYSKWKE
jgi:hypothetical protein